VDLAGADNTRMAVVSVQLLNLESLRGRLSRLNTLQANTYDLRKGIKDNYPDDEQAYQEAGFVKHFGLWWKGTTKEERRIVVPDNKELRKVLIHEFHNVPYAGHHGRDSTYAKLSRYYYWVGMKKDVEKHVKECERCQRNQQENRPSYGKLQQLRIPERRNEVIHIDFVTKLPQSDGYDAIMVIIDAANKRLRFIPLRPNINTKDIVMEFTRTWVQEKGLPVTIVHDNNALLAAEFCKYLHK